MNSVLMSSKITVSRTEGQTVKAGYIYGMRFNSTNSWLIIIGGFPEGQCKGHADLAFTLLVQPWIACSCLAALAIHRLYFGGFQLNQHVLCMFVVSFSTACPKRTAVSASAGGL